MKKLIIIFVVLLAVGCGEKVSEETVIEVLPITQSEVNTMLTSEENFTLVDVRTKSEYDSGHIKGALNIPLNEIESTTLLKKDSKIVVYCQSGARSAEAAKKLVDNGYLYVYDMGGIVGWTYEMETN